MTEAPSSEASSDKCSANIDIVSMILIALGRLLEDMTERVGAFPNTKVPSSGEPEKCRDFMSHNPLHQEQQLFDKGS